MGRRLAIGFGALLLVLVVIAVGAAAIVVWRPEMLRGQIERLASAQAGAAVRITGPIRLEPGRVTTVELEGIEVAAPEWAASAQLASVARLRAGIDVGAWLGDSRIVVEELVVDRLRLALERDVDGRTSWPSVDRTEASTPAEPAPPPEIRSLSIVDGLVSYRDAIAGVDLETRIATLEPVTGGGFAGLRIDGGGTAGGQSMTLGLDVGSPLLLTQGGQPFPINGEIAAGDTRLQIEGGVRDVLALAGLDLTATLESSNPSGLLALAGRAAPSEMLPPLRATARFTADGGVLAARELDVAWGGTTATGELVYDTSGVRPRVEGWLQAPVIDLVELAPLARGSAASTADEPLTAGPLATHDGRVELGIGRIRLPATEITDVTVIVHLEDGQLLAEPLRASLPQGEVSGRLAFDDLDSGNFAGDVALNATRLDLAGLFPNAGAAGVAEARLTGRLAGTDLPTLLTQSELLLDAIIADPRLPQVPGEVAGLSLKAALAPSAERPASLHVKGQLDGEPMSIAAEGGRLDALLAEAITYPLTLDARLGGTSAQLDGTLAWPLTAGGLDMRLALATDGLDLMQFLGAEAPVGGVLTGTANGQLTGGSLAEILGRSRLKAQGELTGLRLPQIEDRLDKASVELDLAPDGDRPIDARVSGELGGEPLMLSLTSGSVSQLVGGEADLPLRLEAKLGETQATAEGTVAWPLERGGMQLDVTASGPDPAKVLGPLGLPEVTLPPYRLNGKLARDGAVWRLGGLSGEVGDSDVAGDLAVDLGGDRPRIEGKLHSRVLDLDDLLGLVGAEPAAGPGETASPEQKAEARADAADGQVLPDERLDAESWQRVDADLSFVAEEVRAGVLPLDALEAHAAMENGRLRVDPLLLRLGDGRIVGNVVVDGSKQPAAANVDLDVQRVPVGRLLQRLDIDVSSFGTLSGRARGDVGVGGRGASLAEILGSANGEMTLAMEGGAIDRQIVDMLGFDFLNLLGSLLGANERQVALSCTLVDVVAHDGKVSTRSLVVDTEVASIAGEGTVDLGSEAVNIELLARPKGKPLPSGRTGVRVTGTLAKPEVSYDAGTLAARGAAATIGTLLQPFAAIASAVLPGVGNGGKPSSCAALLDAKGAG